MAYYPAHGRVLLFGGDNPNSNDTWEWDGVNWAMLSPVTAPTERTYHAMAVEPATGRLVVFGGSGNAGWLNDTWVYPGSHPASVLQFGSGCGTPSPLLGPITGNQPALGRSFPTHVTGLPASTIVVFLPMGLSSTSAGGTPLPLDLTPLGMPGCQLYHDCVVPFVATTLQPGGVATHSLAVPATPSLAGMQLYLQGWAFAPGVNSASAVTSNALALTLGY
jgi:hypothetical protein